MLETFTIFGDSTLEFGIISLNEFPRVHLGPSIAAFLDIELLQVDGD